MSARKRRGVQPAHEWELLLPLFEWPQQRRYEEIRPLVLFDAPTAKRRRLPPAIRRLIVDLKVEYPRFNLNQIANVVRAAFGVAYRGTRQVASAEHAPKQHILSSLSGVLWQVHGRLAFPGLGRHRRPTGYSSLPVR
jgi:hypothetical protein